MHDCDKWLLTGDAARMLHRSVQMVRTYERTGRLPAVRAADGTRLFKESDVRKLATELARQRPELQTAGVA
ncbi:hypothetical protein MYX04_10815 [Nitrospiraceae bacterium AH_259_D15_M11_P09]|nr:hypothetical protein [Nitrospiraceae bacterium AH_259_D15_M11_P09]